MSRRSRTAPVLANRAAAATALVLMALAGCSSGTTAASSEHTSAADGTASATASMTPSTPPSTGTSPTTDTTSDTYPAGLATYPPTRPGGSAIQVTTPCDSGTLTMAAHPDGNGVAMTATLKNPAHTAPWHGDIGITPFANDEGDPNLPRRTLTNGVLTLSGTNLAGSAAIHDSTLNYAWPQSAAVDLVLTKPALECSTAAYLNATQGTIDTFPLHVKIQRRTGTISVHAVPLAGRGPWQITVTATSPHGAQHQTRDVTASTHNVLGASFTLVTKLTGFTNLDDFTTLTITASKADGTHTSWVTVTRTP